MKFILETIFGTPSTLTMEEELRTHGNWVDAHIQAARFVYLIELTYPLFRQIYNQVKLQTPYNSMTEDSVMAVHLYTRGSPIYLEVCLFSILFNIF
jgi:hypothetical protein